LSRKAIFLSQTIFASSKFHTILTKSVKYAIIDVETTGGTAERERITEIAIVLHDGIKIMETFTSLVNPERTIPYNITQITGITQEMVENAPKFYEIAKKIVEITQDAIFVAHNVRFDYSFVREEFRRLGYTFVRKQLCTVRLTRQAFPDLGSYSLGNLIIHFGIEVSARHRALADTLATTYIFERILDLEQGVTVVSDMINRGIKEANLPKNISLDRLHDLPELCGIYYMYDDAGSIIYIGKSINIQKRIFEHFTDKTEKGLKLFNSVHDISYEVTGSELVALLLESAEIKKHLPRINRAQKKVHFPYVIFQYVNEKGYCGFQVAAVTALARKKLTVVAEFATLHDAKSRLKRAASDFNLCHKLCHLEYTESACFHYSIKSCLGACIGEEVAAIYNERAEQAIERMSLLLEGNFFIMEQGRTPTEKAVILVEEGKYCGFGYIEPDGKMLVEDVKEAVLYQKSNPDTAKIIRQYLGTAKKEVKLVHF
jgi:DNA polymerase-3 subunit epsilon